MVSLPRVVAALVVLTSAAWPQTDWQPLFDGKSLTNWRETPFTNHGAVRLDNGTIVLERGKPMTGVTYAAQPLPLPAINYEIRLEASRIEGNDFFASMTFPVGDSFCTWVTGGWGGDIVGLSSIDGWDAADNETRTYFNFEAGRWYALRLQVTAERIQAWIDDRRVIDVNIAGREISLRPGETKLMVPLGFASYGTKGALRNIAYRTLPARSR